VNQDAELAQAAELAELHEQAVQQRAELSAAVHALASRLRHGSPRAYALDAVRLAGIRLPRHRVLLAATLPVAALALVTVAVVLSTRRRTRS